MAEGFQDTWERLPLVTRYAGAVAVAQFALYVVNPYLAVKVSWRLPQAPWWQAWRYVLAPLAYTGSQFNGLIELFLFCSSLNRLELSTFGSRSTTAYYLLWLAAGFNIIGPYIGSYAYLPGLVAALTWTQAQESPHSETVLVVVPMQSCYVPLANIVLAYVVSGGSLEATYVPIAGIVLAHSYMFFTELLPNAGGTAALRTPPPILKKLDTLGQETPARQSYGTGRRLGKES